MILTENKAALSVSFYFFFKLELEIPTKPGRGHWKKIALHSKISIEGSALGQESTTLPERNPGAA